MLFTAIYSLPEHGITVIYLIRFLIRGAKDIIVSGAILFYVLDFEDFDYSKSTGLILSPSI